MFLKLGLGLGLSLGLDLGLHFSWEFFTDNNVYGKYFRMPVLYTLQKTTSTADIFIFKVSIHTASSLAVWPV